MITPPYLTPGDKVAITGTARWIDPSAVKYAIQSFEKWGLQVVEGAYLYEKDRQFAGTDEQRTEDLQRFLDDESIKAVFCSRGGYGTVRIVDQLNFDCFLQAPKWIIGYSDITAIHAHIQTVYGIESIHGTMPVNITTENNRQEAIESLKKVLFGEKVSYTFNSTTLNRNGECKGSLIGGNLSLLHTLTGTNSFTNTEGQILFLEDLDEYLYHVDRMMINLKRSGILSGLNGLIIGGMTDMNDNEIPFGKKAEEIILDAVQEYAYPVCFDFPAGHIENNLALILGRDVTLSVQEPECLLNF